MQPVYIQGGLRTPIGILHGQYKTVRPEHLGAHVLKALWQQYGPEALTDTMIICGNAVGTGGNIGRLAAL